MAKSAPRQSSHVTPHDPGIPEKPAVEPLPTPDVSQPVSESIYRRGFWIALVIWTVVFTFLMGYLFLDLIVGMFRG
jgi:hypothetical protein